MPVLLKKSMARKKQYLSTSTLFKKKIIMPYIPQKMYLHQIVSLGQYT